ncbi:LysR substrate-binding domain-containing protein [Acidipila rosea]|uniref:LysR family transcriptional regulator n=1 Tax=Acidipila rosea TaxID=768535 RepID=A0A4R1LA14_9BACT|nr:LysR substrate-binding domain-containing protein [Acidipila rosea]MBW4045989.1 LysR family transcriptional regulator [Acidobacteriota bacterium]TCK75122.1 LysR family transcriptional regulator [Acidipila rosea]
MENYRLKVFRTVATELNFRKAAESLHVSQPAVSQHVQALEEELGLRLFDRSGQRIALTPAGKTLLKFATRVARILDEARVALAALEGETGGELKLAASTTVAQYILPRILGAFLKDHPRVALSVISGNTERVVELVSEGTAQLGLIEGPARSKEVHVEKFLSDRLVLIAPRSHEWSGAASIPLAALAGAPLLLREQGSGSRRVVEQALHRHGLPQAKLKVVMDLDSTEAIVSGVEAGLGCGFVSEWAIGKELRLGTVALVPVDGLEIERDFSLVRRLGPEPGGATAAFIRFAKAQQRS